MNESRNYVPEARLRKYRLNRERFEKWMNLRLAIQAKKEWRHPVEEIEPQHVHTMLHQFAHEWLTPILLFLAEGNKASGKEGKGTLDKRAWALLYAVRPDLLNGESMADASRKWGVDEAAMNYYVRQFERYIPGFRSLGGGTKKRSLAVREAVGRATSKRHQIRQDSDVAEVLGGDVPGGAR